VPAAAATSRSNLPTTMPDDLATLEAELGHMCPAALDEELLQRLEACAEGIMEKLESNEIRFEGTLRASRPAALDADFLARLEAVVHEVPFAVDEKIVLFPKAAAAQPSKPKPVWSAAAAVAAIGAISAFFIPAGKAPDAVAKQAATAKTESRLAAPFPDFAPASYNRGVSEVRDEGVVWESWNQPLTRVRVVYRDQITLKDALGRTIVVEQPRVEYMMVPARTD
jgi:hypothetical protein